MSLTPPPSVRKLQDALHAKAKGSPDYRFYALYDKVYRLDVLAYAYQRSRKNQGSVGVDGQTFADIEAYGVGRWLGELAQELRTKNYRPQAVRRAWIPKADGGQRPLGIPTIKDRVVQTAAMVVLEAIFEADLQPEQYAYRHGRDPKEAIKMVRTLLASGHREVVDADLKGYFDSIPHAELMKAVARRVSDRYLLHLIKMWLKAPIREQKRDEDDRRPPEPHERDDSGTPQGSPISPLLSNLYMRRFILGWKQLGYEAKWQAHIVNYADDFVICCRGSAEKARAAMQWIMERLKLTVNEAKTHIRRLPGESFDFLGYTFGRCYQFGTGKPYYGMLPSKKRVQRFCRSLTEVTGRNHTQQATEDLVNQVNRKLIGWANYYCLGTVNRAYLLVDNHARNRLRQWLRAKMDWPARKGRHVPSVVLYETYGLVRLQARRRNVSWAPA